VKRFDDGMLDAPAEAAGGGWAALDRLVAGQLSAEEQAALRRQAASDPVLLRALDALQPLGPEPRRKLGDAVERRVATGRTRRRAVLAAGPVLAAAAVTLLFVRRRRADDLPRYALEVTAGDSETRGAPSPKHTVIRPAAFVALVARPALRVAPPVAARAFLETTTGWRELTLGAPSPSGVVRLEGRVATLLGEVDGPVRIHLVVGAPDLVASQGLDLARGGSAGGPGWQRLTALVSVVR
jgi:hypothetical protein